MSADGRLASLRQICRMISKPLLAATAIVSAAPAFAQPLYPNALAQRILAAHNRERALVGAAPLQWDPALAAHAASYGPVLAATRALVHSPRASRPGERENLARAWHGTMSPEQLVGIWSSERALLAPGTSVFPAMSRTGRWEDIAHYTQMVWPTTTRVGCAIYSVDWDYLICRYSPPGNIDGKPVFVAAAMQRSIGR